MNLINKCLMIISMLFISTASLSTRAETIELINNGNMVEFELQASDKIPNHTKYSWISDDTASSGTAFEGIAEKSAAGMVYEHKVPLTKDATLEITYQVVDAKNSEDEKTKPGDDFALRLYVTSSSLFSYKTLVMVHSVQYPANEQWVSPYSGAIAKFEMYVFAGTESELGQWHTVKIPVGRLWQQVFADNTDELDAISFMVDSDNAGGRMQTKIEKLTYSY